MARYAVKKGQYVYFNSGVGSAAGRLTRYGEGGIRDPFEATPEKVAFMRDKLVLLDAPPEAAIEDQIVTPESEPAQDEGDDDQVDDDDD